MPMVRRCTRTLWMPIKRDVLLRWILELPASTTYYIYIWAEKGDIISYSLIIRDPEEQKSGYSTAGSVSESVGAVAGQETPCPVPTRTKGGMIPLETEVSGKVSDGRGQWYAFTTNSVENATYECHHGEQNAWNRGFLSACL